MCRPPHLATASFVAVIACLFTLSPTASGQVPVSGAQTGPAADLERFRSLDPADRLRVVEAHPGAKTAFQAVSRGDLAVAIVDELETPRHRRGRFTAGY